MRLFQFCLFTGLTLLGCGTQGSTPVDSAPLGLSVSTAAATTGTTLSITSPAEGSTLSGMASLEATASNPESVSSLWFRVDGTRFKTLYSAPFTTSWDTHLLMNGPHTLTAEAYDGTYNTPTSAPVTFTVAQPGAAVYDSGLHVPLCSAVSNLCDSTSLLQGRGPMGILGPEPHAPNTLDGCGDGPDNDPGSHPEQIHWIRVARADGRPFVGGRRVRVDVAVEVPDYSFSDTYLMIDLYSASDATAPVWTYQTSIMLNPNAYPEQRGFYVASAEYVLPSGSLQAVRASYWFGAYQQSPCTTGGIDDHDDMAFAVGQEVDVTPPTVSITAPANNAPVSNTVTVKAVADDDFNVTKVEFYDGETRIGTDITPPFSADWYTGSLAEGTHTLTAKAYDAAGHVGTSSVSVLIDHFGPLLSFTSPADNAFVRGTVQLTASAGDAHGVAWVAYYDGWPEDRRLIGTSTVAPYAVNWDTTITTAGRHGLHAVASDFAGNHSEDSIIGVTVDNVPPTVSITSPMNGGTVFLSTTIAAVASDDNAVAQVAFYDGSKLINTDTTAPYSVSWSTLLVTRGQHTLTAQATDAAGNVTTSAPVVVTVQ